MKKLLLTLTVIAIVAASTYAQLSGGVKAGLNLTNEKLKVESISQSGDMKVGFLIGGYLTAPLAEKLAIQPELFFATGGAKYSTDSTGGKVNLGYISVPVLVRYNLTENINIQVGPQLGFLLSAKAKPDGGDSQDVKDSYKGIDFGVAAGLGLEFGAFNASARYYLGLANTGDFGDTGDFDVKQTNSAIQLSVGYRLFGGE